MKTLEFETHVAGVMNYRPASTRPPEGGPVMCQRDRANEAHKQAIGVWHITEGGKCYSLVGYIPAFLAEHMAPVMDQANTTVQATVKENHHDPAEPDSAGLVLSVRVVTDHSDTTALAHAGKVAKSKWMARRLMSSARL